ncbi:hypothetical protein [Paenibacillus stellifer]|uniref:hypothetical protein n=1 Tax=Paenibacillus stellifer TaxID=169760 RepID=UPI000690F018|nr:hypothetical protein [Paenibacillus stellifer]
MEINEHMKETADIMSGYITGRLVVDLDDRSVGLQKHDGSLIPLSSACIIEVRNGSLYEPLTITQALTAVTVEGWPGYAGLYARVKAI